MDNIFGLSMNWILIVLAVIVGICLVSIAAIALFRPVIFKMALRNPPRRKAQTILIILGLMLATLIISSALTTGDTLDHSIKGVTYDSLNRVDISVGFVGEAGGSGSLSVNNEPIPADLANELSTQFQGDPDFETFMPVLTVDVPVISLRDGQAHLSEPSAILTGLDMAAVESVGGIQTPGGGSIDLSALGPNQAVISETLARDLEAEQGDTVRIVINNVPQEIEIYAIGQDSILTGIAFGTQAGPSNNGLAMPIDRVQELSGLEGQARYIAVTLPGGVEGSVSHSDDAETKLESYLEGTPYGVNPVKATAVEQAELAGSIFLSLFLVLGLFSIAAGVLLIFLIFTMLASERRPEMGMARAVGMRQGQLVQQFVAEGTLYDLGSALVGAIAGVGVAFIMVGILDRLVGEFFSINPHWTFRSLAVAYCLGVTVTFITIIFASARASRLNIVSAIRDIPEPARTGGQRPRWRWWKKIPRFGPQIPGIGMYLISLVFFPLELIPNLIMYPFRLVIWIARVTAFYIGWGPLLMPVGAILMLLGWGWRGGESWSLALFSLGLSLAAIGLMLILRRWLPERPVFTVVSFVMLLWWLAPDQGILHDIFDPITPNNLEGDFEMFFISGIMMVTFATLLVLWNADIAVWIAAQLGRAFSRWVPAVKTAVAYPLASKTKTGLTLAMFSLIVFSLVTMATLNANFVELFTTENATGGWDIQVVTNPSNPVGDIEDALANTDVDTSDIQAIGNVNQIVYDNSQVRRLGTENWKRTPLNGVDQAYAENTVMPIEYRAPGYDSDEAVWEAIANDPTVAVIDTFSVGGGFGSSDEQFFVPLSATDSDTKSLEPIQVEIEDPSSGRSTTITIIGIVDSEISTIFGLYMNNQVIEDLYGTPDVNQIYLQLSDGSLEHTREVAREIESALVESGVQAESMEEQLEEQAQVQTGFIDLIQGFMALGLLVGIAALGVISFRAVVERRQQIGMLRAIGFQRNMVAATFLIEAMVVATLGVLSGLILGLILSRNLITSSEVGADFDSFVVPWSQIGIFLGIALVAAILMTIIPSRNAASVPVAEALRYE
ncbi:MAG: FtsX-like permease family protein [Thermomicrobiales bacterium]